MGAKMELLHVVFQVTVKMVPQKADQFLPHDPVLQALPKFLPIFKYKFGLLAIIYIKRFPHHCIVCPRCFNKIYKAVAGYINGFRVVKLRTSIPVWPIDENIQPIDIIISIQKNLCMDSINADETILTHQLNNAGTRKENMPVMCSTDELKVKTAFFRCHFT